MSVLSKQEFMVIEEEARKRFHDKCRKSYLAWKKNPKSETLYKRYCEVARGAYSNYWEVVKPSYDAMKKEEGNYA